MKKTIYGALGLAGACAACCAIPIAFPMLAGASLAGAAGWAAGDSLMIAGGAAAVVAGAIFWTRARRAKAGAACAPKTDPANAACACAASPDAKGCK